MDLDLLDLDLLALDRLRPTGLFTLAEATATGLHRRDVGRWVRDGVTARVAPGTFVDAARWQQAEPERQHVLRGMAATMSLQAAAVLSHAPAAALHGLPLLSPRVDLPGRRLHLTRQSAGPSHVSRHYTLHRRYGADQCAPPIDGVPVVLPVLAAFGVAELDGIVAGVVALDSALHQGKTTLEEAQVWLARLRRRPGTVVIRRVIEAADCLSESPLESQARLVVTALGYRMRLQVVLSTTEGAFVARVDGLIEELGVVLEVDGRIKYVGDNGTGSVEAVLSEKRRDSAIRDLGYGIVRLDRLALDEPNQVDRRIQNASQRADASVRRLPRSGA